MIIAPISLVVTPQLVWKGFFRTPGVLKNPFQTSWGVTTRLIGAIIMVHGDQRGLKLPPFVAPVQCAIIPIASHKAGVVEKAEEIAAVLKKEGMRPYVDNR